MLHFGELCFLLLNTTRLNELQMDLNHSSSHNVVKWQKKMKKKKTET